MSRKRRATYTHLDASMRLLNTTFSNSIHANEEPLLPLRRLNHHGNNRTSLNELKSQGFTSKGGKSIWTEADIEMLESALKSLVDPAQNLRIETRDPYHFLSTRVFLQSKTADEIKEYMRDKYKCS